MQPPTTSCLLHRQNKCQYLLVVRLFRINKCLLLLFIIWEKLQRKRLDMLFSLSLFRSLFYFETLSMLFVHVSNVLVVAATCMHMRNMHTQIDTETQTSIHVRQFKFMFAVLWFWTLCGIKLFCYCRSCSFVLFCFVTVYMVFNCNMPLPVVHFRWLSVLFLFLCFLVQWSIRRTVHTKYQ